VVAANQEIEIGHEGMGVVRPASSAQFSFANGVLTLDRTLLPAAIPELNRWYNADIRLGDPSLRAQRITARLTAGSLTDLTELLSVTFNVRVVRDGRVLTLFPR
jgi:ferric-dicitrate binding protein FerR (iron transport regulator)